MDMPPRISPNRGGHRGGRTSRGGYLGGASRGSQFGGPSSTNAATPLGNTTPNPQVDHPGNDPRSSRGQQPDDRGRGRGRGRGNRRGAPASSSDNAISPVISSPITTENVSSASLSQPSDRDAGATQVTVFTPSPPINSPSTFRGQSAGHRGRGRGSTSPGAALGSSSTAPVIATVPISKTASTISFPHTGTFRGQSSRGRGGHRGARGGPFDFPSPSRGRFPRGGGGGYVASGPSAMMGSSSGIPDHVITFGAKRPGFGTGGRHLNVIINAFPTTVPDVTIYQYDVVHDGKLSAQLNMELLRLLQTQEATIFSPKVAYDGQKIIFSTQKLHLGEDSNSGKFLVSRPRSNGKPKVYEVILTEVATRNSGLLQQFTARELSHDENVSPILAALNVAVKMEPNQFHPFNKRSFYVPDGRKDIGGGIELWKGIFQSVRPTVGRLIVNIDLSTGIMYKEGPLLNLCIDFFGCRQDISPNDILTGTRLREFDRVKLQKFLSGVRVKVPVTTGDKERVVRGLSREGADSSTFRTRAGDQMTVAQYFQSHNVILQYPSVICVMVGNGALIPLELCEIPRGQFMRKALPEDKVRDVLEFSTRRPDERLQRIRDGLQYLRYGQSQYVRDFGMTIDENPLSTVARVIEPPQLRYSNASLQPSIRPEGGAWNMLDKQFYEASTIVRWVVVIYETQRRFPQPILTGMVQGFLKACDGVGIRVENRDPIWSFENGQGRIDKQLMHAVNECERQFHQRPTLIVVVLPNGAGEIYNAVKHFGDITFGIPTQCLKSFPVSKAKPQYWNNVMLKINVKLGGINVIPDPSSLAAEALTDPANPTIVMGADVMHPPPGVNRPSYTAIIGSVDSHTAKYVATSRAQAERQELINDMQEMCMEILGQYKDYQMNVENKAVFELSRLIFYRDGVSESQFKQVLESELPMIKAACEEFGVNPKVTLIIVGKRHHIQFFPLPGQGDKRSGNCFAGTVVDRDVTHPTDHDFYLLSHAGILGTSRPAHYSVLYDESGFNADALQSLSYSLCHVYAPSTRAVSVPAPVYYADMVCSRAKTHFDPTQYLTFDAATSDSGSANLETFKGGYMPLHANQQKAMYFA